MDFVNINAYCVLSSRVTCLLAFQYSGVYAVSSVLKRINNDKRKLTQV